MKTLSNQWQAQTQAGIIAARITKDNRVQGLWEHLTETGDLARQELMSAFPNPTSNQKLLIELATIAGYWHDLGKLDYTWQANLRNPIRNFRFDHSQHGAEKAYQLGLTPVAAAILAHHTRLISWGRQFDSSLGDIVGSGEKYTKNFDHRAKILLGRNLLEKKIAYHFCRDRDEILTRLIFSVLVDADRQSAENFNLSRCKKKVDTLLLEIYPYLRGAAQDLASLAISEGKRKIFLIGFEGLDQTDWRFPVVCESSPQGFFNQLLTSKASIIRNNHRILNSYIFLNNSDRCFSKTKTFSTLVNLLENLKHYWGVNYTFIGDQPTSYDFEVNRLGYSQTLWGDYIFR